MLVTDPDIDFEGVADVADAIEAAGGDVRDFETAVQAKTSDGLFDAMSSLLGSSHERVYLFAATIPEDTERPDDELNATKARQQATVDVLAELLEAGDGTPADPNMTPAQNLRAIVGQSGIPLSAFREAYLDVYDEPPGWDIGPPADADDGAKIDVE